MEINEVIETADEIVFAYSGQRLSDLEQVILKGCLRGLTYVQIAEEASQSDQYMKDIGALLWRKFSAALGGEKVKKSNIQAVLERYRINQSVQLRNHPKLPLSIWETPLIRPSSLAARKS